MRIPAFFGVFSVAFSLSGCIDLNVGASAPPLAPVSAPGVPIAVESITGAPQGIATGFNVAFVDAAYARNIELVDGKAKARFRIKGYLSAESVEDGKIELSFVWDVFDATRQRAQRLTGATIAKKATGADPWSGVDQAVAMRAAADSMDVIAVFLNENKDNVANSGASAGVAAKARGNRGG
ncbi:MAG: hypothetical protein ACKVP7_27120 [Hyphomicrobiaceae bacterium]